MCVYLYACVCSQLAMETGQCDVPSQPMLEWLCLKVLGAARLMTCLLNHCTRAFMYPSLSHPLLWETSAAILPLFFA